MRTAFKTIATAAIVGASAFMFTAAQAASLSVVGSGNGTTQQLPGNYNPAGGVMTIDQFIDQGTEETFNNQIVWFDSSNKVNQDQSVNGLRLSGPAIVRFTYLGTEAGNTNFFDFSNSLFLDNDFIFRNKNAANATVEFQFGGPGGIPLPASGLLPFGFVTNGAHTNNAGAVADNAGEVEDSMKLGFSTQIFDNALGGDSIIVFLGDGLGDSDFDDMIVGVGVFAVPVPPAAILLLTGLFGLGALKRLRRGGMAA